MAGNVRFGMLASLALHILPLGAWWFLAPYSLIEPATFQAERVMAVSLLGGAADDAAESRQTTSAPVFTPESPTALTEQKALPPEKEAPTPGIAPLLPLKKAPYTPAGELDERPFSETPVIIPFPDASLDKPKVTGVLVLYIGANGYVDRIEVDESDLPPDFEKAAIDTFLQARMRPGIKAGQPTRARMKILVEFEQR